MITETLADLREMAGAKSVNLSITDRGMMTLSVDGLDPFEQYGRSSTVLYVFGRRFNDDVVRFLKQAEQEIRDHLAVQREARAKLAATLGVEEAA